ncbi:SseB family protein [Microbacterium sp. ASV49]|uniref:SseB family protein n=1 Tax=Microbacterium candidum TaxID=3041922 RepID=A0ABT7MX42_9MICO|nr:SseB family protein [Microbacterium sp. ASV49]MDL9979023.1 SseB family protein [Microbacterium sp. ASV49]
MAIFSRRPKSSSEQDADAPVDETAAPEETQEAPVEEAPQVNISVSSFGGLGATPEPVAPEQPAPATSAESAIPGLRDNVLLRDAIAALPDDPDGAEVMGVARQMFQGELFLRVRGDARALLAAGEDLPLAIASIEDTPFVLVFSSGAALQAAVQGNDDESTAMSQLSQVVLRSVLSGPYGGIILDAASRRNPIVLPRQLIERSLEEGDDDFTVKNLLAGERTDATASEVVAAIATAPLWLAANRASEDDEWGLAESRTQEGARFLEVFSHPLEVLAMGRGDQPMPIRAEQLVSGFEGDDGLTGIVIDPAGPWIQLDRGDLEPLITEAAAEG